MASTFRALLISSLLVLLLAQSSNVNAKGRASFMAGEWKKGIATFYEAGDGTGREGSCGYRDTDQDMKHQLAATGPDLHNGGQGCGACYEVRCIGDQTKCKPGLPPVTVTATNSGVRDLNHFDLSVPAFLQIAEYIAGIVPIEYRRIPCQRQGGIRFTMDKSGNPHFVMVTVWNVAGAGDVTNVQVKIHDDPNWLPMQRNWGQRWVYSEPKLVGQALSFRVFTGDRRSSTSWDVVPKDWKFGQTFQGKNFR